MSREILFKAKVKDGTEWIKGGLIVVKNTERRFIVDIDSKTALRGFRTHCSDKFDWRSTEVDPDTVCQYTGLTDKNGKKIWENDIVQVGWYKGTVEYENGCFVIKWYNKFLRKGLGNWSDLDGFHTVGNIYDNPELLEEEDKK